MSEPQENAAEIAALEPNAITIELPRAWFDVPRDVHKEPLGIPPYAHGIYDAVEQIEGVKAIYAVADGGYIPHQGLNVVSLEEGADAAAIKQSIEQAVIKVTRPTYGYDKSAISTYEASKARVSTAIVQGSHGQFPFNGETTGFATTFLNNLRDRENPIGEAGKLIKAFDDGLGNRDGNMAVIHQFVEGGVDHETGQPKVFPIIRGLIQVGGDDMDEVKSRFHTATREGIGGLGYGAMERHTVLQVESWPGQAPNA